MKILEQKQLPQSQLEIKISLEWLEWQKYIAKAATEYAQEIRVEGFRKGKAPIDLIEQKIGKAALLDLAADMAIRKSYAEILEQEKIQALGAPKAHILKLAEGNPLEYLIQTAILPEIKLADWEKEIKTINREFANKKSEINEEEVQQELEQLANSRVQQKDVERLAQKEDNVILDFVVKRNGVPIENGSSKDHHLILGRGVFIPGFEEQILGMQAGEEKAFELQFPEDYHAKHLAGQVAQFEVTLKKVQERISPELTDEFARSLGKFVDLAELKKSVKDGLQKEREQQLKEERRAKLVEKLIEKIEAELPEVLVHEELHKMFHEFEHQLAGMGLELEAYLQQTKKTREELEKEWQPQAERRIKAALALEEVAKQQEINVDAETVEAEMNKTFAQYKKIKEIEQNIDLGRLYNYTKGVLLNEKVFEALEGMK